MLIAASKDYKEIVVITDKGKAASLKDGIWYKGIQYDFYEISDMYRIKDLLKKLEIINQIPPDIGDWS